MTDKLDVELLPRVLAEVADVIGLDAAIKLVAHYGGTRLYVPDALVEQSPLMILVGRKAAERLINTYRGDVLWIPRCLVALRAIRDRAITARHRAGEKADALAREFNLTDRAVWHIISRARRDDFPQKQSSLF